MPSAFKIMASVPRPHVAGSASAAGKIKRSEMTKTCYHGEVYSSLESAATADELTSIEVARECKIAFRCPCKHSLLEPRPAFCKCVGQDKDISDKARSRGFTVHEGQHTRACSPCEAQAVHKLGSLCL